MRINMLGWALGSYALMIMFMRDEQGMSYFIFMWALWTFLAVYSNGGKDD